MKNGKSWQLYLVLALAAGITFLSWQAKQRAEREAELWAAATDRID